MPFYLDESEKNAVLPGIGFRDFLCLQQRGCGSERSDTDLRILVTELGGY